MQDAVDAGTADESRLICQSCCIQVSEPAGWNLPIAHDETVQGPIHCLKYHNRDGTDIEDLFVRSISSADIHIAV